MKDSNNPTQAWAHGLDWQTVNDLTLAYAQQLQERNPTNAVKAIVEFRQALYQQIQGTPPAVDQSVAVSASGRSMNVIDAATFEKFVAIYQRHEAGEITSHDAVMKLFIGILQLQDK